MRANTLDYIYVREHVELDLLKVGLIEMFYYLKVTISLRDKI